MRPISNPSHAFTRPTQNYLHNNIMHPGRTLIKFKVTSWFWKFLLKSFVHFLITYFLVLTSSVRDEVYAENLQSDAVHTYSPANSTLTLFQIFFSFSSSTQVKLFTFSHRTTLLKSWCFHSVYPSFLFAHRSIFPTLIQLSWMSYEKEWGK